jgi:putative tricarboxylic transport membrane protein
MSWLEPFVGFAGLAEPVVLLAIAIGAFTGIVIGILPGIGPGVAIAVMLPLTYGMSPLAGITLLLGIYVGAYYGGAVTSILIRTPGEASSIMTMFDGAPMAERGEAERALSLAFASAFIGGIASALVLAFVAAPISQFTSRFGAAENFMAALLAIIFIARAYERQLGAAVMMIGVGLLVGTVGIDPTSNEQRFTFDWTALQSGLPLVPMVIGLFGIAQALVLLASTPEASGKPLAAFGKPQIGHFLEPLRYPRTLLRSLGIGTAIGILPGVGSALSTTMSYFAARRASKDPDSYGKGNPEGIVAAETANNANSGGAMLTVLTLGIPGDAITAIIMGIFIVHGIVPGPTLFADKPDLVYGIFAGLISINLAIILMLLFLARPFARLSQLDPRWLGAAILALCFTGAYSTTSSMYGVWVAMGAGLLGWACALGRLPVIPLVLGLVLGDILESTLRQTLTVSSGDWSIFLHRPIAAVLLLCCALAVLQPLLRQFKQGLRAREARS